MTPADLDARRRALDPATSFIVQAPAGSGKTELLIQRYLRLLSVVDAPEEVVAITFTKKAAAEMRARVVKALERCTSVSVETASAQGSLFGAAAATAVKPLEPHEEVTHQLARAALARDSQADWRLLENPARMRIGTIDALSAAITRRMPWTARFGAFPNIEERAEPMYREAARQTLLHQALSPDAPAATLLLHLDNDASRAESLIAQMLARRDQWLRLIGSGQLDLSAVRQKLEASLARIVGEHLARLAGLFPADLLRQAVDLACYASAQAQTALVAGFSADDLEHWAVLAAFLLTSDGRSVRKAGGINRKLGFPPKHPRTTQCKHFFEQLGAQEELAEALCELRHLPAPRFGDDQWRVLEATIALLPLAVAELRGVFGERETVDFAELTISADRALEQEREPTDLALALGQHVRHLLVDEFQDTSLSQWELFEKLTRAWDEGDGRTLFLVGDPMQSIYRFREADVGLFLRAFAGGLCHIPLEPLALTVNFRSQPGIVEWVNRSFREIMPGDNDALSGSVRHSPSVPGRADVGGEPRIHAFLGKSFEEEAARVVELIRNASGRVAVLVRARTHLPAIVAALRQADVPFQAIEIDPLAERPLIQDLMALTFALLHPADRVSWLAILRAPWCGLTLADLLAIAEGGEIAATPNMSPDGAARLARILPTIERALAERGHRRLRELVESAWTALHGPACVEQDADLDDAAAYFDLLESLDAGGDLASFTELRDRVGLLFAQPDTRSEGAVQIMTIHKAKGLEFDTVILPGLGNPPKQDEFPLILWQEVTGGDLLLAPISQTGSGGDPVYDYLEHLEQVKAGHESERLLYVAATRAREELHLLGCAGVDKDGQPSMPAKHSFLKLLWDTAGVQRIFQDAATTAHQPASDAPAPRTPRTIARLPMAWSAPAPPPDVRWQRTEPAPEYAEEISFDWVGDTLRHIGTVLHACLQQIGREGLDRWSTARVRDSRNWFRTMLANAGVPPAELDEASERVTTGLVACMEDSRARWILSPHPECACEYRVSGFVEGRFVHAAIDRTFVDAEGRRWIIDYKTSAHEGGGLIGFLENEKQRYREQLEGYAHLLAAREDRPVRLGLYFPLLRGWVEWTPSE